MQRVLKSPSRSLLIFISEAEHARCLPGECKCNILPFCSVNLKYVDRPVTRVTGVFVSDSIVSFTFGVLGLMEVFFKHNA